MKAAISVPDADFERFERVAEKHGMSRSEFYRRAAEHYAEQLESDDHELTRLMNAAIDSHGQPVDQEWLDTSQRTMLENVEW